jgi:hypothetical protein
MSHLSLRETPAFCDRYLAIQRGIKMSQQFSSSRRQMLASTAAAPRPKGMRVKEYANDRGTSVPTLYRKAAECKVRFIKDGRRTIVDVEYSDRHYDNLPTADIRSNPHPNKRSVTA